MYVGDTGNGVVVVSLKGCSTCWFSPFLCLACLSPAPLMMMIRARTDRH